VVFGTQMRHALPRLCVVLLSVPEICVLCADRYSKKERVLAVITSRIYGPHELPVQRIFIAERFAGLGGRLGGSHVGRKECD
jgi:hypothetical protein